MTAFQYRAVNSAGEIVEGRMEAADRSAVLSRLEEQGHLPIRADEVAGGVTVAVQPRRRGASWRRRVTQGQLTTMTQEMARLVGAGIPLERVMEIMVSVAENAAVSGLLQRMLEGLRSGRSLAEVMVASGPPFDRLYTNLVHAGEVGGSLDAVLMRLAEHMARMRQLQASIVAALIYPLILLLVALGSLVLLLVFVVPQFESLFADAGAELPLATQFVIATARVVQAYWWVPLVAFLALVLLGPRLYALAGFKRMWDGTMLRLPLIGPLVRKIEVARFSRVLSVLLVNGVPLLTALSVVKESVGNIVLARSLDRAVEGLKAGNGLARPLSEQRSFPSLAVHMIRVGEETGNLDVMLLDVAKVFDDEVSESLKTILALLEPIMILTLGVMMGGIIISILMAILSVNDLAF